MKIRPSRSASILCALGALCFIAIWYVLLFVEMPEHQGVWLAAWEAASYFLSDANPNRFVFWATIFSIFISVTCSILFWATTYWRFTMVIVGVHTLAAIFIYDLALVVNVGMPLVMAPYCFQERVGNV
mgnify:CR=1 FL=1